jgi:hypothetical protein
MVLNYYDYKWHSIMNHWLVTAWRKYRTTLTPYGAMDLEARYKAMTLEVGNIYEIKIGWELASTENAKALHMGGV